MKLKETSPLKSNERSSFDPKIFLDKIGEGRTITEYRKNQVVFSQGDPADAMFYIQKGKVKLTVVSQQGKEAVIAILEAGQFFRGGVLAGQLRVHGNAAHSESSISCD